MRKIKGEAGAMTIASNAVKRFFMQSVNGKSQLRCDHDPNVMVCSTCFMQNVLSKYTPDSRRRIVSSQWRCEQAILVAWETLFRDREIWFMRHGYGSEDMPKAMSFIDTTFRRGGR